MTYIDDAREELLKQLEKYGKTTRDPQRLDLYTLLVLIKGEKVGLADVHDAWAVRENTRRPDHWSIIPFEELKQETADNDIPYALAIQDAARVLRERQEGSAE